MKNIPSLITSLLAIVPDVRLLPRVVTRENLPLNLRNR